jgi:FkbM family methyltransferase
LRTQVRRRRTPSGRGRREIFGIGTTVVRFSGSVFFVPDYAAHRPVSQRILGRRLVSPALHLLVREVMARRPGSMVHAGTFFGDMLPSFSRKTTGTLYAFEPVMENYLLARAVMTSNSLENVLLLHAGLAADAGLAQVQTHRGKRHYGGAARIVSDPTKNAFRPQPVPVMSIDQFHIDDLSLVQLDVEGFELPVLQGAVNTIRACEPVIVIEDNRNNCAGLLAALGYQEVGRIDNDHLYLPASAVDEFGDLAARCRSRARRAADLLPRGLTA